MQLIDTWKYDSNLILYLNRRVPAGNTSLLKQHGIIAADLKGLLEGQRQLTATLLVTNREFYESAFVENPDNLLPENVALTDPPLWTAASLLKGFSIKINTNLDAI